MTGPINDKVIEGQEEQLERDQEVGDERQGNRK